MQPFAELPFLAVDYKAELTNTIYADDYYMEKSQNTVDNLNLLYVAFTRAGSNLYIFSQRGQNASRRAHLMENTLPLIEKKLDGAVLSGQEDEGATLSFTFGTRFVNKEKKKEGSRNVLSQPSMTVEVELNEYDSKVEFRQSNKSREFISGDNDEGETNG